MRTFQIIIVIFLLSGYVIAAPGEPQKQEGNSQWGTAAACVVCLDNNPSTVIKPCGHRVLCGDCAEVKLKGCPVCRKEITEILDLKTNKKISRKPLKSAQDNFNEHQLNMQAIASLQANDAQPLHGSIPVQEGLENAVLHRNPQQARYYIERGADVNLALVSGRTTLLHMAALHNDLVMVKLLLSKGANKNANCELRRPGLSVVGYLTPYEHVKYMISRYNIAVDREILELLKPAAETGCSCAIQ